MSDPDSGAEALVAALVDLEHHVGAAGWEQPARLFALVRSNELAVAEPALADQLGLVGQPRDALTAIEQDTFAASADVLADLAAISWPPAVFGCAVTLVRTFLPAAYEAELPADPEAAAAVVAAHPQRQDVRVVVGVDRLGHRYGVGRLVSQPDELLAAEDLVPGLASALAHTLV